MAVSTIGKICGTLLDGRTVVSVRHCHVLDAGDVSFELTVPHLTKIETILDFQTFSTSPPVETGSYGMKTITGNVIGVTLFNVGAGATICSDSVYVGF